MKRNPSEQALEQELAKVKMENELLRKKISSENESTPLLLLDSISESLKDTIILSVDTNYRYLYLNNANKMAMKINYGVDAQLGMNILDCITIPEDKEKARNNYSLALNGTAHSNIEKYGDAPHVYYESFFSPIRNTNNEIIGASAFAINVTKREEAKLALKNSVAKHKAMISNIGDVIGVISIDGITTYKSPNIELLFGWKPEELIGQSAFVNIHPDDLDRVKDVFDQIVRKEPESSLIEFRYRLKDDTYRWVELNVANNVDTPSISGILINYHDIADRKYSEEELKRREAEYRNTVNSLRIGVVVHDKDASILLSNPEASNILGLSADQLMGKEATDPAWQFVHEDLSPLKLEEYPVCRVLATKQALTNYVLGIERPDRNYITWGEVNAIPIFSKDDELEKVLVNFVDITARKEAEAKIIESEQTFRALFEKGPIGVAYHKMIYNENGDPIDYQFLAANKSYQELTGVNPTGKLATEAFPGIENDPADWIGTFGKVAKNGIETRFQQYLETNDRWYDCVGYQYKPDHFVAAFLEITEQKRAEISLKENQELLEAQNNEYLTLNEELHERNDEYTALNEEYRAQNDELQNAKDKAEESDRLKTAFLQNMSHEIRTPMNAICGFSEMLNEPDITEEKRENFISIIQNSSNQLLSIVSDILTISSVETKQEKVDIQPTNINGILVQLLSIFESTATIKNVSLYTSPSLPDDASEIFTDKTKITQILTNLLSNALKFTHIGQIEFGYTLKDTSLEFFVKDSGIGIRKDSEHEIFDRFRQADITIQETYGGTGLGLAISKGFVQLLSGEIWVESELGKGSTFYFSIPYDPVTIQEIPTKVSAPIVHKTILVAEDEIYNFLYIKEVLEGENVSILHAKNGQEAIDICTSNPNVNMVFMDIKMPVKNGYDAACEIKQFRPDLTIVAQTAYALESEKLKYSGGVFDAYITKPIESKVLLKLISENY